ncbi:MAG: SdrD B-like domain-containing protein, partial [Patescibacteria group bacterium]
NDGGTQTNDDFAFSVNEGGAITFEADGQNELTVEPGTYTIDEETAQGYVTSHDNCDDVSIAAGETATCTISNDDIAPKLTVIKHVVTDSGGDAIASDFTMNVNGTNVSSPSFAGSETGVMVTLNQGSYSVDEATFEGYDKALSADCSGTINIGEEKTCTITNDDQPGTLIVKKVVVNDNGGSAKPEDFSFTVDGGDNISFEADGENQMTVDAGTYTVVENLKSGYSLTDIGCVYENESVGQTIANGKEVTIDSGDIVTCTFTNTYTPAQSFGSIHGYKWNDLNDDSEVDSGEPLLSGWTIFLDDNENGQLDQGETSMDTSSDTPHFGWYWFENLPDGTYSVCEVQKSGWTQTYPASCHTVTLPDGNSNGFEVTANAVIGPEYNFGNHQNEVVDICPNIDGPQTSVPDGMTLNSDNQCVETPTPPCTANCDGGGGGGGGGRIDLSIFNEATDGVTIPTALVSWFTNLNATCRVVYGTSPQEATAGSPNYGYPNTTDTESTPVTYHTTTLTDLEEGSTYYWRPICTASGQTEKAGAELHFVVAAGEQVQVLGFTTEPEDPKVLGFESLPTTSGNFARYYLELFALFAVAITGLALGYRRTKDGSAA